MRYLKGIACIVFTVLAIAFVMTNASAIEYEDISEHYEQLLDGIPEDVADMLPREFFSGDIDEINSAVSRMSGFEYILDTVMGILGIELGNALKLLATLLGVVVLSALLKVVCSMMRSNTVKSVVSLCSTAAVLGAVLTLQYDSINMVKTFLDRLNVLANSIVPIMGTLYAMGGNVAQAAVSNSAMVVFLTVCETLCNRTVMPVAVLCLGFALASAFSPQIDLRGIAAFIKKSYTVIISFVMMLLMTVLAAQSTLASASDGIAARAAKFVAGNFIPVVGGSVGESLKTVAGSVRYIRSTVGVAGIIIIVLLLLPTLISVITARLAIMLSGTAARMLGCHEEASILGELTSIYGYFLAVICACSVMFIFALTLLAHTSAAVGG